MSVQERMVISDEETRGFVDDFECLCEKFICASDLVSGTAMCSYNKVSYTPCCHRWHSLQSPVSSRKLKGG